MAIRSIVLIFYLLYSYIPKHRDPVDNEYNHFRSNIILKRAIKGGDFYLNNKKIKKRIIFFRPDIEDHSVSKIEKGNRYILSLGWLSLKKKK